MTQAQIPSDDEPSAPLATPSAPILTPTPSSASARVSRRPSLLPPLADDVSHPRGRIWPLLPRSVPRWRRLARAVVRLGQGLHYHDVFRAAPAMAFHFFLSLLPLLVFVGYLVGLVAQSKGVSAVLRLLLDNMPAATEAVLQKEVGHLANAGRLGPIAAIGFLWIASGGIHGLMDSVEMVVGAPRRAWWKQRLFALGWVVVTFVVFGVASFGFIEWDNVVNAGGPPAVTAAAGPRASSDTEPLTEGSSSVVNDPPEAAVSMNVVPRRARKILRSGGERVLTIGFSLAVAVAGLSAFYRFAVTHSRRVRRRLVPGAVVALSLWIVVSWGFSLYLSTLGSYTVYYGSLAAVAVLLVWLWLMSLAILVGAELNAQLEGLRDELEPEP